MKSVYCLKFWMALTKITVLIFLSLAIISTLLAKFQNLVHVGEVVNASRIGPEEPYPDHQHRHLMVALQVTDLHLSIYHDPGRGVALRTFCSEVVPVFEPSVVLATGDLTDARTRNAFGSEQYEDEWKTYKQILQDTGVTGKTVWLDIRGNHDNFNIISIKDEDNFFRRYSEQGMQHLRSYKYTLQQNGDVYTFIGIDACMDPGPKRPFNFLGVIHQSEYSMLRKMAEESKNSNLTIWFGHYPTSTIAAPHPGAKELMRNSGPYLCGHLHTLGGIVPTMYTLQSTGSLELELGDWKDNRRYRLIAVDHGLFTFTDQNLGEWPVILVTNPKHALYGMPSIEPLVRIRKSTHIRALVFSSIEVETVRVQINDEPWRNMSFVQKNLFIALWNPKKYLHGLHQIKIHAKDKYGREHNVNQPFSLDGTRPTFPLGARMALMGHISVAQAIFGLLIVITVIPLCVLRCMHQCGKTRFIRGKAEYNCFRRLLFKLYLLSSVDYLLWPIVIAAVYVAVGPWFVGEIIDGYIGVCFSWGIIIAGKSVPGGLTFVTGSIFMLTFYIPVVFLLAHSVYLRYRSFLNGGNTKCTFAMYICHNLTFIIFISWQILCAVIYWYSYGLMAFLLGFGTTWFVLFALILWRIAVTLGESKLPLPARHLLHTQEMAAEPLCEERDTQQPRGNRLLLQNEKSNS